MSRDQPLPPPKACPARRTPLCLSPVPPGVLVRAHDYSKQILANRMSAETVSRNIALSTTGAADRAPSGANLARISFTKVAPVALENYERVCRHGWRRRKQCDARDDWASSMNKLLAKTVFMLLLPFVPARSPIGTQRAEEYGFPSTIFVHRPYRFM